MKAFAQRRGGPELAVLAPTDAQNVGRLLACRGRGPCLALCGRLLLGARFRGRSPIRELRLLDPVDRPGSSAPPEAFPCGGRCLS